MPFCSVIIPTYNRAQFLKEAVDSVLNQTFKDLELIVVDDGSTDDTFKLLLPYVKSKTLRYFIQHNLGIARARNAGIKFSNSPWIAFLDSDDFWLPKKLERQIEFLKNHPHLKICQTNEIWIRKGVRVNPMKKHKKFGGWIFEKCLPLCIISPSACIIHREVFEKVGLFDEKFPVCEDYEFWLRASLNFEIGLLNEYLIVKRGGHQDQLSKKFEVMDRFRIKGLEKVINLPDLKSKIKNEQLSSVLKILQEKCRIVARGALKRKKVFNFLRYFFKYLKYKFMSKTRKILIYFLILQFTDAILSFHQFQYNKLFLQY